MRIFLVKGLLLAMGLSIAPGAPADPLHALADGAYWHHDSGWIFPARIGDFVRAGAAQDIAGTRDAVAYYARAVNGVRIVVSVDVFPTDSAAEATTFESARQALAAHADTSAGQISESVIPVSDDARRQATRVWLELGGAARALYFVEAGDWRVRIRVDLPPGTPGVREELDRFVRQQRWGALGTDSLHDAERVL